MAACGEKTGPTFFCIYFFFLFSTGQFFGKTIKKIEPTLVGENSFGEFDGAQFARRLFPGVVFRDTSGKFP